MRYYVDTPASVVGGFTTLEKVIYDLVGDIYLNTIVDELKKFGHVQIYHDMCIICVVGDLQSDNVGFESKATEALKEVPVHMISYGGSDHNISFLISAQDKQRALQALSDNLFN